MFGEQKFIEYMDFFWNILRLAAAVHLRAGMFEDKK